MITLELGRWYAMTMYPGYSEEPYRSPVEMQQVEACGSRMLRLRMYDIGYAAGVQDMTKDYRVLSRSGGAMVTQETSTPERITIFEPLTAAWVAAFVPAFGEMMITAIERGTRLGIYHQR